ncbi:MAG: tRNA 4-thiouridine(8) synthase ThiI [Clostridia bacterium]|nr:tRNA 4-thiouridine(8) synthase ThiI [Clostridia bacterium]
MKEVILCKYGEIVLKGANRSYFEGILTKELKRRAKKFGSFKITHMQSTVYIEPLDEFSDFEGMYESVGRVFGISAYNRAAVCEKDLADIMRVAREYIPAYFDKKATFKVEAKRSDKRFPLKSPEIAAEVGGALLEVCPRMRVDVRTPDITVKVEVREEHAYVHAAQQKGSGGMPVGSNGRGLLLLSGGIDSPVAAYMMAKRGVIIEALHFESYPYTSERAREKVVELARIVSQYAGKIHLHVISLTHIQEELVRACEEDYFTLLLRRYMMTLADRCAEQYGAQALITGESVGQVASQTMQALAVTDICAKRPVFRPCIGLDKEEIIEISRRIGTFETSTLPYEDCCTVFTPKHPRTKPELEKVLREEAKLDFEALCDEAYSTMYTITVE